MQPHVQVKLIEFEAILAGLTATRKPKMMMANLAALDRVTAEVTELTEHITNRDTLRIILDAFQRGDAAVAETERKIRNGSR